MIVHSSDEEDERRSVKKINKQPERKGTNSKTNRYALEFFNETREEILLNKEEARREIIPVSSSEFEISTDDYFDEEIDFPKRPKWSYEMSREELEIRENRYFTVIIEL